MERQVPIHQLVVSFLRQSRTAAELALRLPVPLQKRLSLTALEIVAKAGYFWGRSRGFHSNHGKKAPPQVLRDTAFDVAQYAEIVPKRSQPQVAALIPVFAGNIEEVDKLADAIQGLQCQSHPPCVIIVVNDASPHKLRLPGGEVQVIVKDLDTNGGPGKARNAGFSIAKTIDVLCCTDSDCLPDTDWVEAMARCQAEQPGIVYGNTRAHAPDTWTGLFHDLHGTLNPRLLQYHTHEMKPGEVVYGTTCNMSISMAHVDVLFDEEFTIASFEDLEWSFRARKEGVPVAYTQEARLQHCFHEGPHEIFRQFQRYGAFNDLMVAKHPEFGAMIHQSAAIPAIRQPVRRRLQPTAGCYSGKRSNRIKAKVWLMAAPGCRPCPHFHAMTGRVCM